MNIEGSPLNSEHILFNKIRTELKMSFFRMSTKKLSIKMRLKYLFSMFYLIELTSECSLLSPVIKKEPKGVGGLVGT